MESMPLSGATLGRVQDVLASPDLIALPVEVLHTDGAIECQLYLNVKGGTLIKFSEPGLVFNRSIKQRLVENRRRHLFVKVSEGHCLNRYLEANLKHTLVNPRIPPEEKASVLFATTTFTAKALIADPSTPEGVKSARNMVDSAVDYIFAQPSALRHILAVSSYDYYTFTHSVNVMTYALSLGRQLGFASDREIKGLGLAALVHDVGKAYISPEIILKTGPLSDDEFEEMKKHPDLGFFSLQKTAELSDDELSVVRRHHEKLNGNGYPFGLSGNEIDDRVRIITCVDMYDALTTRRTYREALSPYMALSMMKRLVDEELDPTVFREFVSMIGSV